MASQANPGSAVKAPRTSTVPVHTPASTPPPMPLAPPVVNLHTLVQVPVVQAAQGFAAPGVVPVGPQVPAFLARSAPAPQSTRGLRHSIPDVNGMLTQVRAALGALQPVAGVNALQPAVALAVTTAQNAIAANSAAFQQQLDDYEQKVEDAIDARETKWKEVLHDSNTEVLQLHAEKVELVELLQWTFGPQALTGIIAQFETAKKLALVEAAAAAMAIAPKIKKEEDQPPPPGGIPAA